MSEQISALIDGEIEEGQAAKSVSAVLSNKSAVKAARDYQLIGDIMRGADLPSTNLSQSIMDQIELEPTILSPNAGAVNNTEKSEVTKSNVMPFRLPKSWSIAASVAAVMMVGAFAVNQDLAGPISGGVMTVALSDTAVEKVVPVDKSVVATVATIPQAYIRAHRASAPSVSSHYIQTVNFSE